MAGASLFLPFLPMLPVQILLNNFLYDVSELPIPLDRVDDDYLSHPRHWDMNFIRNFMLVIGPVSSIFDFLTSTCVAMDSMNQPVWNSASPAAGAPSSTSPLIAYCLVWDTIWLICKVRLTLPPETGPAGRLGEKR